MSVQLGVPQLLKLSGRETTSMYKPRQASAYVIEPNGPLAKLISRVCTSCKAELQSCNAKEDAEKKDGFVAIPPPTTNYMFICFICNRKF